MFDLRDTAFLMMFATVTTTLTATVSSPSPSFAATEHPLVCEQPELLTTSDQARRAAGRVGESHCYRLDVTSAGLLHFDVSTPAADAWMTGSPRSQARLEVTGVGLDQTLGRTPNELLALTEPGALFVVIRAEDPRQPLPAYRLASRFAETSKSEEDDELELEPDKSEEDDELELEPDKTTRLDAPFTCGGFRKGEEDDELELEPDKSEEDDELELEPDKSLRLEGLLRKPARSAEKTACDRIRPHLTRLCRSELGDDDHGDSLACSREITRQTQGELANGWGDDADVFRFEIESWQTVELVTEGLDTHVTLFDRQGQRLDAGETRLVRTLGPGTYFVRVEGLRADGPYALKINDLDR
ncbi:MAG: hypothetical protein AAF560_02740 [Acidobacteriota bacterium]